MFEQAFRNIDDALRNKAGCTSATRPRSTNSARSTRRRSSAWARRPQRRRVLHPAPALRAIIQTIDPGPGETIYDGAFGSAGFLCEAFDRLRNANPKRTTVQDKALQVATFSGKGKKFLAYVIGIKNLILSDDADPNSMPGLEILNDEVRCSHGATNGPVSANELFYMAARGISKDKARRLIVNGLFNNLLARLENETLRTHLETLLVARFSVA